MKTPNMKSLARGLAEDSGGFWKVNKVIANEIGLEPATVLAELQAQRRYFEKRGELANDGTFFRSGRQLEKATGISEYGRKKSLRILKEKGFIKAQRKTKDGANYYKIDDIKIADFIYKSIGRNRPKPPGENPPKARAEIDHLIRNNKKKYITSGSKPTTPRPSKNPAFDFSDPDFQKAYAEVLAEQEAAMIEAYDHAISLEDMED